MQRALCVSALEDYLEISAGPEYSGMGSYCQASVSPCNTSASQAALVASLCPGVIPDAGSDL